MNNQTVAEDITQETFLRFISQKGSIHGYEIKYLYTIARNLCVDEYRRVKPDSLPEGYCFFMLNLEDVMKPLNLTVTDAARILGVSRKALSEFVNEKASLSPEMAIRISKATNTFPESWMNMQQKLTLWTAQQHEPSNVIPFPLDAVKEG